MSESTTTRPSRATWWSATVAGMASYLDGAITVGTGTVLVLYQQGFGLTAGQVGQLSALLTVFFAFGALIGGRLGDRFGRRHVFTVTMIVLLVGAAFMIIAAAPWMLYVGVILLGFGAGADLPVSLAMIAETAPEGMVGRMITYSQYLWMAGITAVVILGVIVGGMGSLGGRIFNIHLFVIALAVLLFRLRLPESKVWTTTHTEAVTLSGPAKTGATLGELFRSRYRWPLIATALFYVLLMVALNTNGQFSTYLYVNAAGSTVQVASTVSLITLAVVVIGTTALLRLVDSKYRFAAFLVASVLNVAAFVIPALVGVSVQTLVVLGVLFALGGAIAGEPMFKVWSQELFPTQYRSTAQGMSIFAARLVAAVVALFTPALISSSVQTLFVFLAATTVASCLVGLLWIFRFKPALDSDVTGAIATHATQKAAESSESASVSS